MHFEMNAERSIINKYYINLNSTYLSSMLNTRFYKFLVIKKKQCAQIAHAFDSNFEAIMTINYVHRQLVFIRNLFALA